MLLITVNVTFVPLQVCKFDKNQHKLVSHKMYFNIYIYIIYKNKINEINASLIFNQKSSKICSTRGTTGAKRLKYLVDTYV